MAFDKSKIIPLFIFAVLTLANNDLTQILVNPIEGSDCSTDCCRTLSDRLPMTFTYYQKSGRFVGGSGDFKIDTHGYSGQGKGYNNPDQQCTPGIGALPASTYKLSYCKNVMHQTTQRPCAFYLDPQKPEQVCGRGDFFIHGCQCCTPGDDTQPPTNGCSAGCVVISYANRRKLRIGDTLIVKHLETQNQILSQ